MINFERVFNNLIVVGVLFGVGAWVYVRFKKPNYKLLDRFKSKGGGNNFGRH
jgi:hypothetical protein